MRKIIFFILIAFSTESFAISKWYKEKNRGWYWYEDNNQKEQEDQDSKLFSQPKTPKEAVSQIMKIRKVMEEARAYAILTQKEENTARYIKLQKHVLDITEKFNISWQDALRLNPYLDETINNPVSGRAKEIKIQLQTEAENEKIKNFGKEYGLLIFSKEGCPYCHAFIPILKEFAETYNITLLGISQDGSHIEGIKQINNAELLASLPVEYVPAVYAINPYTGEAIVISSGLLSLDELRQRVLMAINHKEKTNAASN
jgi:conjugal transfer pilus assembly protein TraF